MSTNRARRLRRDATDAEKVLWRALRARGLQNTKFRRQWPVGRYIVDFVAFEPRLIIEVDGGHHPEDGPERSRFLEQQGFHILRYWNNEVLANLDGVLVDIHDWLERLPPLD